MVLEFFRGGSDQELEQIEELIHQMLIDCRHTFDLAINALLGGTDPSVVGPDIRETDRSVNKTERAVRKQLVVHTSVRGAQADLPLVLASMSIVKDAERVGDYAKNIWDLASEGTDLSSAEDLDQLLAFRDMASRFISDTARIFNDKDGEGAHELLQSGDAVQDDLDAFVVAQLQSTLPASEAVPRALLGRYLKRIVAHLMNVLTSLVMPLHRLDYYDEDKADRI